MSPAIYLFVNSSVFDFSIFFIFNSCHMKRLIAIFLALFLYHSSSSQLSKGYWMEGGQGSFKSSFLSVVGWDYFHTTEISVSPSVGYFIKDRLAIGLKSTLSNYHFTGKGSLPGTSGISNAFDLSIGPFARYYFLNNLEGPVNVFLEGAYGIGYHTSLEYFGKKYLSRYSFLAGPVYYINNSIGLEFAIGYYSANQFSETRSGFQVLIGLQIHLIKEK